MAIEIYINNTRIDTKEDFPLSITKQISDIQRPDTRQADFTKTITIPNSKTNAKLFGNIFDIASFIENTSTTNFNPDFNPNLKADTVVYQDGAEIFKGFAQLISINKIDNDDIEYNIVIFGNLDDLFKSIGDSELTDLDFSEFNHDFTRSNIEDSWDTAIIQNGTPTAFSFGTGYVYPLIDYGYSSNLINFELNNTYPAIYTKEYIDKIFEDAGFVYQSTFLNSAFFKKLIIPFNGGDFKMTSADINNRLFKAQKTSLTELDTPPAANHTVIFDDDSSSGFYDNSNQYNTGTGVLTIGTGLQGTFNFVASMQLGARFVPDTTGVTVKLGTPSLRGSLVTIVEIVKETAAGVITVLNSRSNFYSTENSFQDTYTWTTADTSGAYSNLVAVASGPVTLAETDKIYARVYRYLSNVTGGLFHNVSTGDAISGVYKLQVKAGSIFYNVVDNANYVEGMPINMNSAVPEKVKQKDFLMSIIKMFNLYVQPDPDVSNKLIIEPRNTYYTNDVIDWSEKLDISKAMQINPMGLLDTKEYVFKYKADNDYLNKRYQDTWVETFGQRDIEVNNDFLSNVKTIDVIFSATPSYGDSSSDRIIPRIVKVDANNVASPVKGNIRILHYSGLKTTNQTWYIHTAAGNTAYTSYPYAGHLDDPYTPTVDLSWGVPAEIYYTNIYNSIVYTNKNLVNQYYVTMINEISDRNSKIVRAYMNLTSFDVKKIDFRKTYYFDREYYRLNKVIDYNPNSEDTTLCEFIHIRNGITFSPTLTSADDLYVDDRKPRFRVPYSTGDNVMTKNSVISGNENRSPSSIDGVIISGDGNMVGENTKFVFIDGINNSIAGDTSGVVLNNSNNNRVLSSDVTLINTNNATITEPGLYINGQDVTGYETLTASKDNNFDKRVYYCDCTDGNIFIVLPLASAMSGNFIDIKKIDSTANVVAISAASKNLLDNVFDQYLEAQYEAITLHSDGTKYWII